MKNKKKIVLGLIAAGVAGILVGVAISNPIVRRRLAESLTDISYKLNLNLLNIIDESKNALSAMRLRLADTTGILSVD